MSTAALVLTDNAAAKVRKLREGEANPLLKLRVYITGGGCSGFSYGFTFDEEVKEGDTEFQNGECHHASRSNELPIFGWL